MRHETIFDYVIFIPFFRIFVRVVRDQTFSIISTSDYSGDRCSGDG